ncbi:hypothetical protein BD626DRAFT_183294 [Schizophyllum amplum]|uniref:Uncharacterized protein n=1 Tax=Schizophyllum amplum TaxID=97359 RepID=A0A550C112_9AGAR|nr:hypothetical protein BD626DRAFT_183294 [Auriculariopsis ampla]
MRPNRAKSRRVDITDGDLAEGGRRVCGAQHPKEEGTRVGARGCKKATTGTRLDVRALLLVGQAVSARVTRATAPFEGRGRDFRGSRCWRSLERGGNARRDLLRVMQRAASVASLSGGACGERGGAQSAQGPGTKGDRGNGARACAGMVRRRIFRGRNHGRGRRWATGSSKFVSVSQTTRSYWGKGTYRREEQDGGF